MRPSALSRCASARGAAAALALAAALGGGDPARAAGAPGAGRIVGLQAHADAAASVVEVLADRPLSFTTLQLASPARVVLDFADAELSGVPAEIVVEDGTVRRVGAAAAGARTARVVIELSGESEFDVRAVGARLEVRIARSRPAVASRGADAPRPAEPAVEAQEGAPRPAALAPDPAPPAALAPDPAPPAAGAAWVEVPPVPEPAQVEALQQPKVAPIAAPPVPAVARVEAPKVPEVAPIAAPPAPAVARVEAPPRPAPAVPAPAAGPAADERAAALREREKRASLPTVSIAGPDAAAAPLEPPAPAGSPGALAPSPAPAGSSAPPGPPAAAADARVEPAASAPRGVARPAGKRAAISGIGFRPEGQGVVLVRSDRAVEYSITRSDREVLLRFASATISVANNRRPLDTRFFGGPIERIVPVASADGTEVRIELREPADFQVRQAAGLLTVTFTR